MNERSRLIKYIEEIGVKLVHVPGGKMYGLIFYVETSKKHLVEFNNLRYIENDIKTFLCANETFRKLIEIKKGNNKAVTNIASSFSKHIHNIYLTDDILYYQQIQSEILNFFHLQLFIKTFWNTENS